MLSLLNDTAAPKVPKSGSGLHAATVGGMSRLLTVHAHPDDESSKGAPTCAKVVAEGHQAYLVCCTGGEAGDVLNPAVDADAIGDMAQVRRDELARAVKAIGFTDYVYLGYHDSGMPDSPENAREDNFANAADDEAAGRLVTIIRRWKPHVIVTYADDQQGYQHPDHLKVHDVSVLAYERAGDPDWYPWAGEPWQPQKLYYSVWSRARLEAHHQAFGDNGLESPYDERWFERPSLDHRVTTKVPIEGYYRVRRAALLAHETQVDPNAPFWFGLPDQIAESTYPYEDYILARSEIPVEVPESDLFAGIEP